MLVESGWATTCKGSMCWFILPHNSSPPPSPSFLPSPPLHIATPPAPLTVMHLQLDMGWAADEEGGDFYNPDGIKEGGSGGRKGGREGREGRGEREARRDRVG